MKAKQILNTIFNKNKELIKTNSYNLKKMEEENKQFDKEFEKMEKRIESHATSNK